MTKSRNAWTEAEARYVSAHMATDSPEQIAAAIGRTVDMVKKKIIQLECGTGQTRHNWHNWGGGSVIRSAAEAADKATETHAERYLFLLAWQWEIRFMYFQYQSHTFNTKSDPYTMNRFEELLLDVRREVEKASPNAMLNLEYHG